MVTKRRLPQTPQAKKVIDYSMEERLATLTTTTWARSTFFWALLA